MIYKRRKSVHKKPHYWCIDC